MTLLYAKHALKPKKSRVIKAKEPDNSRLVDEFNFYSAIARYC
ncbi:hypothetical protein LbDm2_1395 [Levilactobacillus brevis]|nr:hypothetical protein LbDm2_1395 [Levilactobacillus brevis]